MHMQLEIERPKNNLSFHLKTLEDKLIGRDLR